MTFNPTDLSIIGPALVAGILVLATHVPMGREVLRDRKSTRLNSSHH